MERPDETERQRLLAASGPGRGLRIAAGIDRRDWRAQLIGEFRRAFPAAAVAFGRPDKHGGHARVARRTQRARASPALRGEDFAELAADMRIRLLVSIDRASSADP